MILLFVFIVVMNTLLVCGCAAAKNRSLLMWGLASLVFSYFALLVVIFVPTKPPAPTKEEAVKRRIRNLKELIIVLVAVCFLLLGVGIRAPFIAHDTHAQIQINMTGKKVRNILRGSGENFAYCDIDKDGSVESTMDDNQCFETVAALPNQQQIKSVALKVSFMGPAFWHNDFVITFGPDGKVKEISPLIGWD